jgi:tRNA C32,U32 (ribose-2'-O)-methylase TrmJ
LPRRYARCATWASSAFALCVRFSTIPIGWRASRTAQARSSSGFRASTRSTTRSPTASTRLASRRAAAELLERAADAPVAIVFGREDNGLPNEVLDQLHAAVTIPTTEHSSLNLAQAVLIGLYELHLAAGDATRTLPPPRKATPPPTTAELEQFFTDAERALAAIDFFKTRNSEHIMRSVRSMTVRAGPDSRELSLARSIALEVLNFLARTRQDNRRT